MERGVWGERSKKSFHFKYKKDANSDWLKFKLHPEDLSPELYQGSINIEEKAFSYKVNNIEKIGKLIGLVDTLGRFKEIKISNETAKELNLNENILFDNDVKSLEYVINADRQALGDEEDMLRACLNTCELTTTGTRRKLCNGACYLGYLAIKIPW
jgi:hypothetical protein